MSARCCCSLFAPEKRPQNQQCQHQEAPAWSLQNALVLLAKHRPGRRRVLAFRGLEKGVTAPFAERMGRSRAEQFPPNGTSETHGHHRQGLQKYFSNPWKSGTVMRTSILVHATQT